jgi:enoyl-CoA hydratase/carnithine racemase
LAKERDVSDYTQILYDVADGVATITLHRPEKMNAFTPVMMREMIAAFDQIDADDAVRAVIVTGHGDRAFCAGADLTPDAGTVFASDAVVESLSDPRVRDSGGLLTLRIYQCNKPVIAAINGAAVGIGATMQLAMDIRMASDNARFGFVFVRRGIVPEAASSWFLPRLVGYQQALEWCFTGRIFDAQEALKGGLIRSVHPADQLMVEARKLAREIADNAAPVSVALTRHMLWRNASEVHPMAAHIIDSKSTYLRAASSDAAEGIASFLEKRPAIFPNQVSADMPACFPWWQEPLYD